MDRRQIDQPPDAGSRRAFHQLLCRDDSVREGSGRTSASDHLVLTRQMHDCVRAFAERVEILDRHLCEIANGLVCVDPRDALSHERLHIHARGHQAAHESSPEVSARACYEDAAQPALLRPSLRRRNSICPLARATAGETTRFMGVANPVG